MKRISLLFLFLFFPFLFFFLTRCEKGKPSAECSFQGKSIRKRISTDTIRRELSVILDKFLYYNGDEGEFRINITNRIHSIYSVIIKDSSIVERRDELTKEQNQLIAN